MTLKIKLKFYKKYFTTCFSDLLKMINFIYLKKIIIIFLK